MKLRILIVISFVLLYIGTYFANKFVLSVLKFTFPTIFQGWQTLVGILMFRALYASGYIDNLLHGKDWLDCALWLPGMITFLMSSYAGSRALATLPLPVYFAMQNMVLVFKATADVIVHGQMTSFYSYFMLMISLMSALIIAKVDPHFDPDGYFWMCIHIVSLGCLESYTHFMQGKLKLRATDKLFSCYLYSFIVLAPSSYFLGDTLEAVGRFQYFYVSHFYVGCILSGVLGVLLNLCSVYLQELKTPSLMLDVGAVQAVAKILCSGVSLTFFDMTLTQTLVICLAINFLSSIGYIESSTHRRLQPNISYASMNNFDADVYSGDRLLGESRQYFKRQELQQDMIRLDLGS